MKNITRTLLGLLVGGMALTMAPSLAQAENFSLHEQIGISTNLTNPQTNTYTVGPAMELKPLFALTPNFAIGPAVQAMYFPRATDNGQNAGLLWQAGVAGRLQGRRDDYAGTGVWSGASPYIDVDLMAANTGNLYRPSFNAQLGLEGALDQTHTAWFGAFLEYTHMFQTDNHQDLLTLDKSDPNIFQVGLSLSFDFPVHRQVVRHTVHETVYVAMKPDCAPLPPPEAAAVEVPEVVYFDWDKASLRWESKDKIDRMVVLLNEHTDWTIDVQGHASSDGNHDHNDKLSQRRSLAVAKYLMAHGIDKSRLVGHGFGPDAPAPRGDNTTQEGRERNRRVEFVVRNSK